MSLNDAHAFAFSLATTLMAAIIIFQAGDGTLSVMLASEYDGDAAAKMCIRDSVLSIRQVLPDMPMMAALSAAHLAAILFPDTLRRLYILRDDDPAGDSARDTLVERANAVGIEAIVISPQLGDFNEDLRTLGIDALRSQTRMQIGPQDVARFMALAA